VAVHSENGALRSDQAIRAMASSRTPPSPSARYDGPFVPHLLRLSLKHAPLEGDGAPYPFSAPQIRALPELDVNVPVTFFVENGSAKSTLPEGIAAAAELPAMGGSRDVGLDSTLAHADRLGASLRRRGRGVHDRGSFCEPRTSSAD
jgi:hypothetical protein